MRVLQLGKFYPVHGGVEKVMGLLRDNLPAHGISSDLLCCNYDVAPYRELKHPDGGRTFICRTLLRKFGTTFSPQLLRKLSSLQSEYDLIHIHHPDPMAGWALWRSGYRGKVVLQWHSDVLVSPWLYKLYQPIEDWLLNRADKVVGTTPVYVEESPQIARGLRDRSKLDYVPIGIPEQESQPQPVEQIRSRHKGRKLLLSVGRLVPYKGLEYLLDMAEHLPEEYLVVIAGRGPLEGELKSAIEARGLGHKVELIGFITREEKAAYLEACTLFILSSVTKNEAFAIVQIEAMQHSKPVISTRIPESGVPWVNKHHDSGLTVPVRNGKALAEAVLEVCSDPAGYQGYAERARKRYEEHFTIDRMIRRCIGIYRSI